MLIGIMSDSHDSMTQIKKAVELFRKNNVDYILHAGDFIAPFSIEPLKNSGVKEVIGVYGNNDGEKEGLEKSFLNIGGRVMRPPYKFALDGLSCMMMHEPYFITDALDDPEVNVVIYGHTHKLSIEERAGKMVINPGEVLGYISGRSTICLLDNETMETRVLEF
ncbi:MAG: metallophosphoesterase [Acidobacteria bacterium]|nr:metallophosphoesterase [Acidobacteriota bacterium]